MSVIYNLFNANFITFSTRASGSSFKMAKTTFCEGAAAKPSMVNAAMASSCTATLMAVCNIPPDSVPPAGTAVFILSLRSTMTRCAVFRPMPLTVFYTPVFSVLMTLISSLGESAERIMRAVLPPMPDTEINCRKSSRSCLSAKPYKMYASSRIASWIYNLQLALP